MVRHDDRPAAEGPEARLAFARRSQAALIGLAANDEAPFDERLEQILRVSAYTIGVERVSYWSWRRDRASIVCESLYNKQRNSFGSGGELARAGYPAYFAALKDGRLIVADDAHRAPQTREFSGGYLDSSGIGAMMDAPVYVRGELVGVVCHEHVGGPRCWTIDEQLFAMSIGQIVALAIEANQRERAEQALRESEKRLRSIVECTPIPMLVTTRGQGICLYANRAAAELLGVPEEKAVGLRAPSFYRDASDREALIADVDEHGGVSDRELRLKRADGSELWGLLSAHPIRFDGEDALLVALVDVTERKRMEQRLRHLATHDPLTELPNRVLFFSTLERELAHARRTPSYDFGVLFVDLDDFKVVNDTLGHSVGDRVLRTVAARLTQSLRPRDVVARLGGDEFSILIADVKHRTEVIEIAQRLTEATRRSELGDSQVMPSLSIGAVISGRQYADAQAVVTAADSAMYEAKEQGKTRFVLVEPPPSHQQVRGRKSS